MATTPYAELHAHTNFSFLDGASAADDLVERAVAPGLTALAVTDHNGLYGAVRFMGAAEEVGIHGVVGTEIDLLDPAVPDPDAVVFTRTPTPASTPIRTGRRDATAPSRAGPSGLDRQRAKLPGHRDPVKEDFRGIGDRAARPASRPAGPDAGRLAQPEPAHLPREPCRHQGRAAVPP